jgi:hypothetical protein
MIYAKINEAGEVLQFPYRLRPNEERNIPADVVRVDTTTNKLSGLKWYEGMWYDQVVRVGDAYQVTYTKGLKKYSSEQEKKQVLTTLIADAKMKNTTALQNDNITQEQHDSNVTILNSINVDDETTYDLYNTITL